ncbi:gamma-butyrobetaine hydroxylase-like domain-containing protein [Trinickia sp. EG282A]|uniref:gamma-butyrobetaine hydroxylase-like domain-containing protein n=1 Tax=Trinickia sp. EG282A TaxID=3237013 RepID=UPI0034D17CD9
MKLPSEIRVDRGARLLTLRWPDGDERTIGHAQLRESCPCAECRRRRLAGDEVRAAEGVSVTDLQSMGYGMQIVFSDGHARGIYPWTYLAQLA